MFQLPETMGMTPSLTTGKTQLKISLFFLIIFKEEESKKEKGQRDSKHIAIHTADLFNNYFTSKQLRRKSEPGNFLFVHNFVVKQIILAVRWPSGLELLVSLH